MHVHLSVMSDDWQTCSSFCNLNIINTNNNNNNNNNKSFYINY